MVTQSRAIPVILTRPAAQAKRFAESLTMMAGDMIRLVHSPLLRPDFLAPQDLPKTFDAVIFTSETAVAGSLLWQEAGLVLPRRAYCVGDRTAMVAAKAGFDAISAKGDATALIGLIRSGPKRARLLHLRGQDTRAEIALTLSSFGLQTTDAVVYAQRACPLTDEALVTLAGPDPVILPVFSPRTAAILMAELHRSSADAPLFVVAISGAAGQPLVELVGGHRVFTALRPNAGAMLDAVQLALKAALAA